MSGGSWVPVRDWQEGGAGELCWSEAELVEELWGIGMACGGGST